MVNLLAATLSLMVPGVDATDTLKAICGPTDGPALELAISLPKQNRARLIIQLYQGSLVPSETPPPHTVEVKTGENGQVHICPSPAGECVDATSATLFIEKFETEHVVGRYVVSRRDKKQLTGRFRAKHVADGAHCG